MKLWQKFSSKLHPLIEEYTVGDDNLIDKKLLPYDITASIVHAKALQKANILTRTELSRLIKTLNVLQQEYYVGKITITIHDEDCHTFIENYLTKKLGNLGKKIHTGRSRNDQILTVLRLYIKDQILQIEKEGIRLVEVLLQLAQKYSKVPFPGYSHTQQAMLSSLGHYFASFLDSLLDDLEFLKIIHQHLDKNPLGSAAGFGTAIPLDRDFTTKELGFSKIQINSLYCQNSRGKFESIFLEGLTQIMLTLGKLANDFLVFTSQEFDFFEVSEEFTTGSSIMPQKRNLDILEILRGNVSVVISNQHLIKDLSHKILSGYNRDFQLMKKPLIESARIVDASLKVMKLFLQGIDPKERNIQQKITKNIFSADLANELVIEDKIPFRDAYKKALLKLKLYKADYKKNISDKNSLGAPGNLQLNSYKIRLNALKS